MSLKEGSSGSDVAGLQNQLGVAPDGKFGPGTESAVAAFQREHGLEPDGIVGPQTAAALKKAQKPPPKKQASEPPADEQGMGTGKPTRYTPQGGDVTEAELHAIMPHLRTGLIGDYLGPLNLAMREFEITTRLRKCAFLAQIAHESVELRYFQEIASGQAYDITVNPKLAKRLGNVNPGDGKLFKGRGPIQLTGRGNYIKAGAALHLPLEEFPESAASPAVGFRIAGWFWSTHGLNALADKEEFVLITKRINGGTNGLASRQAYYKVALNTITA